MLEILKAKDLAKDMLVIAVEEIDIQGFTGDMIGTLTEDDVACMDASKVKSVNKYGVSQVELKLKSEQSGDKSREIVDGSMEFLFIAWA